MDFKLEIAKQIDRLPPEMHEQVLRYVTSLAALKATGEKGSELLPFASSIDTASAAEMRRAIEQECERIDPASW